MTTELEIRANAMLAEVRQQRDFAYNRCASLAAEIALLQAALAKYEKRKTPKLKAVQTQDKDALP